jgi:hypothetical protein
MNRNPQTRAALSVVLFVAIAFSAWFAIADRLAAQSPIIEPVLPKVTEITDKGEKRTVPPEELSPIDIAIYQRFQRKDAPDEVCALEEIGLNGGRTTLTEIIVRGNEAEVRFYPDDCEFRYFHRNLTTQDLERLHQFVANKAVDTRKDYSSDTWDGVEYRYFHSTRTGGHRLSINNPPEGEELRDLPANDPSRVYSDLVALFAALANPDRLQVKYFGTNLPAGLEVLFAHPKQRICMVWTAGDDIRVLVDGEETPPEWRAIRKGKLGPTVACPDGFSPFMTESWKAFFQAPKKATAIRRAGEKSPKEPKSIDDVFKFTDRCQPWQVIWDNKGVRGGRYGLEHWGTWIYEKGKQPEHLFSKPISHQLVSPDGHWLVGTLEGKLICYDLAKRESRPLEDAQTVNTYEALYYLPTRQQVLLSLAGREELRKTNIWVEGTPSTAAYRLLDPATGKTSDLKNASGLWCLHQSMERPFQATSQPGVVWTAQGNKTWSALGRFDTKEFRFRNQVSVGLLDFNSNDVWVDEPAKKFYVVFRGHLLRLPLPADVLKDCPAPQMAPVSR